jgi:hypothetical protein
LQNWCVLLLEYLILLAMKTYGHLRNEHSQLMARKVSFAATTSANSSSAEIVPNLAAVIMNN